MHNMEMYENLRDMLEKEVKEIQREGNLDTQKLDNLYKLMSALKHTNECIEEESEGASYESRGRSRASYERSRGSYGRGGSYERGRGGRSNDYMMPYSMDEMSYESRDNFRYSQDRGRSNAQSYGYSRDNSRRKMVQKLETLMDDTMSEYERNAIENCIDKIK